MGDIASERYRCCPGLSRTGGPVRSGPVTQNSPPPIGGRYTSPTLHPKSPVAKVTGLFHSAGGYGVPIGRWATHVKAEAPVAQPTFNPERPSLAPQRSLLRVGSELRTSRWAWVNRMTPDLRLTK